ncbi:MAG: hypothetical protein IH840_18610 [Candidatus Heimdallarchaeota archaeon]|nr:hypothetical protein [Candidatus Heimdallarchaeota archaeon]
MVIYAIDDLLRTELATMLLQERDLLIKEDPNLSFDVQAVSTEEDVVELVKFENCGFVIIDNMKDNQVDPLRLAELVKDFAPAIQTLLLTRNDKMDDMLIDSLNNDFIDYLTPVDAEYGQILTWTLKGLEVSANIKRTTSTGEISAAGTDGSAIAKSLLRENLGSFVSEIKPELFGLLITQNLEIIYDRFFNAPGVKLNFDKHMLAALVTSLKDVGGEIFMEEESISTFEIGGADLVIKQKSGFLFIYFVRNLSPNTSVLVSKELDAVSSVFNEIITEAGNNLPLDLLEPIFNEIIERTRRDFTSLFAKLN